jgi:hypothetical protein
MEKQGIDIIKEKVSKMKDCATKERILKDIEDKKKHNTIRK